MLLATLTEGVKWTDIGQVVVPILLFVFGFPIVYSQVVLLIRTIQANTLSQLYDHHQDVIAIFFEKPYLKPYFYDNERLGHSADPALRQEVETMCELMAAVLEHALVQEHNVPKHAWKQCWEPFIVERLHKSEELERYLRENLDWFAVRFEEILKVATEKRQHHKTTKSV